MRERMQGSEHSEVDHLQKEAQKVANEIQLDVERKGIITGNKNTLEGRQRDARGDITIQAGQQKRLENGNMQYSFSVKSYNHENEFIFIVKKGLIEKKQLSSKGKERFGERIKACNLMNFALRRAIDAANQKKLDLINEDSPFTTGPAENIHSNLKLKNIGDMRNLLLLDRRNLDLFNTEQVACLGYINVKQVMDKLNQDWNNYRNEKFKSTKSTTTLDLKKLKEECKE